MTQRDKLIGLLDTNCGYVDEIKADELADYLLNNGVVVLPCSRRVFIHSDGRIQEMDVCHYQGNSSGVYYMQCECIDQHEDCESFCGNLNGEACAYNFRVADIGKIVFLTKEEAEQALKGGCEE